MDYVKIKLMVDGNIYFYTHIGQDGTVFMVQNKAKATIVPKIECQDIFPIIREYFENIEITVKIESVKA